MFRIWRDRAGQYRFSVMDINKEILATSEPYASHAGCRNGVNKIRLIGENADVIDETMPTFITIKDKDYNKDEVMELLSEIL